MGHALQVVAQRLALALAIPFYILIIGTIIIDLLNE